MATGSNGAVESTREQRALTGSTEVLPARTDEDEPQVIYVREPAHWGRRILVFIGTVGLIVALFFGLVFFKILPGIGNLFSTQTTDRTGPVLLTSIQDMSKYVAAEGNFQVLVDLQENNKYIPDFIFNKRTLFVGVGSVNAYVDFSKITDNDIVVQNNRTDVTIKLPAVQLDTPSLDVDKSYVFDEEKGAINHIGDLFGGNVNDTQQLYQLARDKISDAANQSELAKRAEGNTKLMLQSLLKQLAFERVTIIFPDDVQK
jgi:Protein of unknown function (DUF4230)